MLSMLRGLDSKQLAASDEKYPPSSKQQLFDESGEENMKNEFLINALWHGWE
jgi:hypothetical protein